jgi:uncharacterized protein YdeI (YjbR/CyaY-like superfamily)
VTEDLPADAVLVRARAEWRQWLQQHHDRTQGVWLVTFRQGSGEPAPGYDAVVEEALCFGWVDSRPKKLDERRTMLWFAPRKPGSGWARPNKLRVERLIAQGLMAPAGLAKVEAAQADGSWTMLDAVEDGADGGTVPDDLAAALAAWPDARRHWDAFPRSARRGILEWIVQAKTAATRDKRVCETARLAQQNQRANQWSPKVPPTAPA